MKVLALVIFAAASVASLGSGPYLPSGWKPQGPAFYLPSEVQKLADNPLKDTILQESEASGSDALREYGPPKVAEVSQDLTSQALPDAVTEQAFIVIKAKAIEEVNGEVREVSEERVVQKVAVDAEVKAEAVTEAILEALEVTVEQKASEKEVTEAIEENTTAAFKSEAIAQGRAIDVSIDETTEVQEGTTDSVETTTAAESTEEIVDSTAAFSVKSDEAVVDSNVESTQVTQVSQVQEVAQVEAEVAQVRTAEEGVKDVVEALVNLENEIKAQQIQTNDEEVELKTVQVLGPEAPEGFLEYGPPGFREYGPPQGDELLKSAPQVQEPTEEEQKVENNETRRRRFSPKFRASKKQH